LYLSEKREEEVLLIAGMKEKPQAYCLVEILEKFVGVLVKRKKTPKIRVRKSFNLPAGMPTPDSGLDEAVNDSPGMGFHHQRAERRCNGASTDAEFSHPELKVQKTPDVTACKWQRGAVKAAYEFFRLNESSGAQRMSPEPVHELSAKLA
jgi:hypothetical protein